MIFNLIYISVIPIVIFQNKTLQTNLKLLKIIDFNVKFKLYIYIII